MTSINENLIKFASISLSYIVQMLYTWNYEFRCEMTKMPLNLRFKCYMKVIAKSGDFFSFQLRAILNYDLVWYLESKDNIFP